MSNPALRPQASSALRAGPASPLLAGGLAAPSPWSPLQTPGAAAPGSKLTPPAVPSLMPSAASASQPSTQELVLESFLNRMWSAQSDQSQPFRITPKVLEGLALIFPYGAPLGAVTVFDSTEQVMDKLRRRLDGSTDPIDPNAQKVLDRLPSQEKPLKREAAHEKADPQTPPPGSPGPNGGLPDIAGQAEAKDNYGDAAAKALEAAFAVFRATELGKELEKSAKEYVFSKKGIPLVIFVTAAGIVFLALDDPKLPSVPEIPIGEGISLKLDLSAKGSEVPGLLSDLVHQRSEGPATAGTPERKVGVTATFTFEALGRAVTSVGHFFAEAATWIGKGVVKAGTAIGKGIAKGAGFLAKVAPELLFGAGGAALGAGIGAIAGGGVGALIGAGVGLAVGIGAGLVKRFLSRPGT